MQLPKITDPFEAHSAIFLGRSPGAQDDFWRQASGQPDLVLGNWLKVTRGWTLPTRQSLGSVVGFFLFVLGRGGIVERSSWVLTPVPSWSRQ
jgi:hypothetical protein